MRLLFQLGSTLVLITTCIAGCATPERCHRAAVLSLPYNEFDQAYGNGWRSVFERGEGLAAVELIEDYVKKHGNLSFGQRKFLHLHAAQVLALEGKSRPAICHLDQAMSQKRSPELWPDWDDSIRESNGYREAPFGTASNHEPNPKARRAR